MKKLNETFLITLTVLTTYVTEIIVIRKGEREFTRPVRIAFSK